MLSLESSRKYLSCSMSISKISNYFSKTWMKKERKKNEILILSQESKKKKLRQFNHSLYIISKYFDFNFS